MKILLYSFFLISLLSLFPIKQVESIGKTEEGDSQQVIHVLSGDKLGSNIKEPKYKRNKNLFSEIKGQQNSVLINQYVYNLKEKISELKKKGDFK